MACFVANNNGENHYVNACNQDRALWLIKQRLLKMFGKYNITDIKPVIKNDPAKDRVSTLNGNINPIIPKKGDVPLDTVA